MDVFAAVSLIGDELVGFAARKRCAHFVELDQAFVYGVALRPAHVLHTRLLAHVAKHRQHVHRFAVVAFHDGRAVNHAHDATTDNQIVADGGNQFAVEVVLLRLVGQRAFNYLSSLSANRVLISIAAHDTRTRGARIKRSLQRLDVGIKDIHSGDALLARIVVVAIAGDKRGGSVAPTALVVARIADLLQPEVSAVALGLWL